MIANDQNHENEMKMIKRKLKTNENDQKEIKRITEWIEKV